MVGAQVLRKSVSGLMKMRVLWMDGKATYCVRFCQYERLYRAHEGASLGFEHKG